MPRTRSTIAPALVILILAGCTQAAAPSPTAGSPSPVPTPIPTTAPYGGASAVIPVAAGPRGVVSLDDSIWVASTLADEVLRVDPTTNEVAAVVDAGGRPVTLVIAGGRLWASVLNGSSESDDEVVRIDTVANAVDLRVTIPVHHNIAVGADALWVQDLNGHLRRVDETTGAVTEAASTGIGPVALAANGSSVFGLRSSGTVWRWPMDGGELLEADLGYGAPGRSRIAATDDVVVVAVPGLIVTFDPTTLQPRTQLMLPEMSLVNDLYVTGGDVWLSANVSSAGLELDGGSILLLDPASLEVRHTWRLGPESSGVVPADDSLWAVDQSDDVLARYPLDILASGG